MPIITSIKGRIIFNSRGDEGIEIDVVSDDKYLGRACSPSGASVGKHEVINFKENNAEKSLQEFNKYLSRFIGITSEDPHSIHEVLKSIDDSENYSHLGGSVAYALSVASLDSASRALGIPLFQLLNNSGNYKFPFPLGNVIGGGSHAGPGTPDIQEFLICPIGANSIVDAIKTNLAVHHEVRNILESIDDKFTYGRGDEGAWAPNIDNDKAIEILEKAILNLGYTVGKDVAIGIDFASSSFWNELKQNYEYKRQGLTRTSEEQIEFVNSWISKYKIIYVEDPVHEEDFEGMSIITAKNSRCIITGDDMLVTNQKRIRQSEEFRSCSGAILKINQAGTVFDAINFAKECNRNKIKIITSHRSGESVDSHISEIAIATNSKMLKAGVIGGERISKLNQLIRLNEYDLIKGMVKVF